MSNHSENGNGVLGLIVLIAAATAIFLNLQQVQFYGDRMVYLSSIENEVESIRINLDEIFSCDKSFEHHDEDKRKCADITMENPIYPYDIYDQPIGGDTFTVNGRFANWKLAAYCRKNGNKEPKLIFFASATHKGTKGGFISKGAKIEKFANKYWNTDMFNGRSGPSVCTSNLNSNLPNYVEITVKTYLDSDDFTSATTTYGLGDASEDDVYEIVGGKTVTLDTLDTVKDFTQMNVDNKWDMGIVGVRCKNENGWFLQSCIAARDGKSDALPVTLDNGVRHKGPVAQTLKFMRNACITNDFFEDGDTPSAAQLSVHCVRDPNKKIRN